MPERPDWIECPDNRLYLVEWGCSIFVAVFGFYDIWAGSEFPEFLGGPPWIGHLVGVAFLAFLVYVFVLLLTAIAWIWISGALLKEESPPPLHPVFATVLLVFAVVALFVAMSG